MSPDWALRPIAVPYATFGDPQTLNLYTYVENSPLNRIDADGHQCSDVRSGPCNGGVAIEGSEQDRPQRRGLQAPKAQNQSCPASACVTASAPKSFWGRIGGWFGGVALGFARWGRLGGPAHRAAVEALANHWRAQGYTVNKEQLIRTPKGAKSYRFADVYGEKTNPDGTISKRIGQIGRTYADGRTPVAREQSALNDLQVAEPNSSVEFYDYQAPFPSETGIPGWPVPEAPLGIPGVGEGEAEPVDPEIIP
jgi:hypothetical protein